MGGMVAVGFRFKDGTKVCQERWTNNTPYWLKDPRMYYVNFRDDDKGRKACRAFLRELGLAPPIRRQARATA